MNQYLVPAGITSVFTSQIIFCISFKYVMVFLLLSKLVIFIKYSTATTICQAFF